MGRHGGGEEVSFDELELGLSAITFRWIGDSQCEAVQ
jgi:hypothetical protein